MKIDNKKYKIENIGDGWYSFKSIPQGYVKIDCLHCRTDRKAINQAKRLVKGTTSKDFEIIISKK